MQVLCAILCDFAADYSGKLTIVGAFDTIVAPAFPITHAHCSFAIRVLFNDADEGRHKFDIKLIDTDGRNLLPRLEPAIDVKLDAEMFFRSQNFVINLQGLKFEKPGQYSIDVAYDGEIVSRVPLQVISAKAPV